MINREQGDAEILACPWPECKWVLRRERLVARAAVPTPPGPISADTNTLIAQLIASVIHEDAVSKERDIETHLDSVHPGWTVEEARAHLESWRLRARVHGTGRVATDRVIANDGRVLEGEIL